MRRANRLVVMGAAVIGAVALAVVTVGPAALAVSRYQNADPQTTFEQIAGTIKEDAQVPETALGAHTLIAILVLARSGYPVDVIVQELIAGTSRIGNVRYGFEGIDSCLVLIDDGTVLVPSNPGLGSCIGVAASSHSYRQGQTKRDDPADEVDDDALNAQSATGQGTDVVAEPDGDATDSGDQDDAGAVDDVDSSGTDDADQQDQPFRPPVPIAERFTGGSYEAELEWDPIAPDRSTLISKTVTVSGDGNSLDVFWEVRWVKDTGISTCPQREHWTRWQSTGVASASQFELVLNGRVQLQTMGNECERPTEVFELERDMKLYVIEHEVHTLTTEGMIWIQVDPATG